MSDGYCCLYAMQSEHDGGPVIHDSECPNYEAPECEEFNVVRQGMCKAPLDSRGECPDQLQHGDEFSVRS